jgi:hypothetical protein
MARPLTGCALFLVIPPNGAESGRMSILHHRFPFLLQLFRSRLLVRRKANLIGSLFIRIYFFIFVRHGHTDLRKELDGRELLYLSELKLPILK